MASDSFEDIIPVTSGVTRPSEEVFKLEEAEPANADKESVQADGGSQGGRGAFGGRGGDRRGRGGRGKGRGRGSEPNQETDAGLNKRIELFERPGTSKAKRDEGKYGKKTNTTLKKLEKKNFEAVYQLAKSTILQTTEEGGVEGTVEDDWRTRKLNQEAIEASAGVAVARKRFAFDVPYGPYVCSYSQNGAHMLVGGRKGHVALMHCESMKILTELHLHETIRAVKVLHSFQMFAVAQAKNLYVYDHQGVELHCLKMHRFTTHLDFLPYHYLMVVAGENGNLAYRDISTGQEVSCVRTKMGACQALRQNPKNAVMHMGSSHGLVTLWTPNVPEPVVKMSCHPGHVTSLAVHGNYMVTCGSEGKWKIHDLRKYSFKHQINTYGHAPSDVDISMTGMVAVGFGAHVQIWKNVFQQSWQDNNRAYLEQNYYGQNVTSVRFRPYEDVLGVGHSGGFGTMLVPGAGFANFDTYEANPFETSKQRKEREVRSLMEKLQPESIMLDPSKIGNVNAKLSKQFQEELEREKEEKEAEKKKKEKKKMRGRNKVGKRMKKKALTQGKEQRKRARDRLEAEGDGNSSADSDEESDDDNAQGTENAEGEKDDASSRPAGALGRFYGKRIRKT